ncbi:MAG: hypothetical protein AB1413_04460 [Thermodesulfobacteriota bacterium]
MPDTPFHIVYTFTLADGSQERFDLELDPATLTLRDAEAAALPRWTTLSFHQCAHCPCTEAEQPFCPAAANLVPLLERLDHLASYEQTTLEVVTVERCVTQKTTAQRAISSLMGLMIAASCCPHTHFFKPMARFHLPLASEDETIYRATANFMLAQYFRKGDNPNPDCSLDGLNTIYRNMQAVNRAMAARLRATAQTDSSVNAIILLDMYAKSVPYVIRRDLEELRPLFAPYLASPPPA